MPPPPIEWSAASCQSDGHHPTVVVGTRCIGGYFDPGSYSIAVAIEPGVAISRTTFSHELMHAHLHNLGLLDGDPDHTLTTWWDMIGALDDSLRSAGL